MPQLKNAYKRYRLLYKCFRNRRRRFFIEDLLDYVNDRIDYPISERQLREDISYMESSDGYEAPIEKHYDGHRKYYRYKDTDYSIMDMPINQSEIELLENAIGMLSRFKGLPKYDWIEDTLRHFEETFNLSGTSSGAIVFNQNPYLQGIDRLEFLIEAVAEHKVLKLEYHKFGGDFREREIHPYQLRQYNNRWFLIGYEPRLKDRMPLVVVPIDRIDHASIDESIVFQEYKDIDIEDYFKDIVGVSLKPNSVPQKIIIRVLKPEAEYIKTKPMHVSQRIKEENEKFVVFELKLIINYEFETLLLTHAHMMTIVEPISLRDKIHERAVKIAQKTEKDIAE